MQTYEKVDENTLKVTETATKETSLTIAQIDHELAGINADIKTLNDRHAVTIAEFTARKEKYEAMKAEATKLGVVKKVEPVIIMNDNENDSPFIEGTTTEKVIE